MRIYLIDCNFGLFARHWRFWHGIWTGIRTFCVILRPIMEQELKLKIEEDIIKMLKTVYDPELPVDVYSLGLIYKIDLNDDGHVDIDMTLTAPNCPIADFIFEDVRQKVESVDGVTSATVNLVFEPEWDPRMMTDEAKLELGMM